MKKAIPMVRGGGAPLVGIRNDYLATPLHKLLTHDQLQEFQRLLGSKTSHRRYAGRKGGAATGPTSPAPELDRSRLPPDSLAGDKGLGAESGSGGGNADTTATHFGKPPFVITGNDFTSFPPLPTPQHFS